ncbi:MAG: DUF167 domain-containing protein [Aquificae bacterium]|nr:DUF167 domain-containing protein [Aquificota bacterium]
MKIQVKVKPSSKKEGIRQIEEGYLEVRVNKPPEKGKANQRVVELLAEHFGVSKSKVKLLKGETSREKLFEIIDE